MVACASCSTTEGLWDEHDTVYCTPCGKRTWVANGELALVKCPDCGNMKDAKAYYCHSC